MTIKFPKSIQRTLLVCWIAILLSASEVFASPILDFTGGDTGVAGAADVTFGWEFSLTDRLMVGSLGFFDVGGDGLAEEHTIALWDSKGISLLATAIIGNDDRVVASTSADGRWLFEDIPEVELLPGNYVIAAHYLTRTDKIMSQILSEMNVTTDPRITWVNGRSNSVGEGFSFPEAGRFSSPGFYGANLAQAKVAEPGVISLLIASYLSFFI